ncbi:hypothetical protein CDAR_285421 [Caerostris darwini]|uniref:Uncharacterized protein n=1 Tax=Caerostris darwini TaxID=1538125 RepID=A0AAV4RK54_9ARAC|nr:hypothetical protein CDAR_285421 [Caerostris darwini]
MREFGIVIRGDCFYEPKLAGKARIGLNLQFHVNDMESPAAFEVRSVSNHDMLVSVCLIGQFNNLIKAGICRNECSSDCYSREATFMNPLASEKQLSFGIENLVDGR